jgi:hypothetical protein
MIWRLSFSYKFHPMPAKVPRATNMNSIKEDIKDICFKLRIPLTFKQLQIEAYLEGILN